MTPGVKRIHLLGIPVDVVRDEDLPGAIESLYGLKDHRQIVFLNFHEMMRARYNSERRRTLNEAALIIPVSRFIVRAAKFLKKDIPPMRGSYPFIIRLLGILERKNKSIYLLGTTMRDVRLAESTLKATFPGLQIVGRYASRFSGNREDDVITAIKKSSPTLLLAGKGLKGRQLWICRKRKEFAPGLSVYEETCFDVFSGRRSKPDYRAGSMMLSSFFTALIRPWRFFRVFLYIFFYILLLVERIRG